MSSGTATPLSVIISGSSLAIPRLFSAAVMKEDVEPCEHLRSVCSDWSDPATAPPRGRVGVTPTPAIPVIIVLGPARLDHRCGTRRCVGDCFPSRFGDHLGRLTWAQPGEMRGTDPQQAEAGRLVQLAAAPRPVGRSAAGGTCWFGLPRVGALVPGCGGWESEIT